MDVMNEDEVSTGALLQLFHRAFLTAHIDDDGDLYITDGLGFPIWVSVDTDQRLIRFFTFMQRDEGRPFTKAAANHVNATVALPTFHVRCDQKDRLCSHYGGDARLSYSSPKPTAFVRSTIRRRTFGSLTAMNALASSRPSDV